MPANNVSTDLVGEYAVVIQEIELENFKSFLTRQKLPLAPITLLYGPNGGGKSSVIQALLALRQSLGKGRGVFVADGPDVSLGGFENVVSRHDVSKEVCISLKLPADELSEQLGAPTCELRYGYAPSNKLEASITAMVASWEGSVSGSIMASLDPCERVARLDESDFDVRSAVQSPAAWALSSEQLYQFVGPMLPLLELSAADGRTGGRIVSPQEFQNILSDERLGAHFLRLGSLGLPSMLCDTHNGPWDYQTGSQRYGYHFDPVFYPPEDRRAYVFWRQVARVWEGFADELRAALFQFVHVEPLRQLPQRVYRYGGLPVQSLDLRLQAPQHWADILKAFHGYDGICSAYMQQFGIPYKLHVRDVPVSGESGMYQVLLEDLKTGSTVTLADVGFGVSQMLPILVQGMALGGNDRVIAVQQPELHLHPRLQGHLADFLVDFSCHPLSVPFEGVPALARPLSQWIIETHSEALITRLQRRIRERRIRASDVSVLYLDKIDDLGTVVTPLRLDDDGNFMDEWPGGFFEDGFDDVFGGLA